MYTELRKSLALGGLPARVYAERLRVTLDAVDRFFGDAGMADRTLWPRAFGLRTPAPLWTPASFDRCLLLALVYPIGTIFVMWVASGHVGPAERALGLPNYPSGWSRGGALVLLALSTSAYWRSVSSIRTSARLKWLLSGAIAGGIAAAVVGSSAVSITSVVVAIIAFSIGVGSGSGALALTATLAGVCGFDPPVSFAGIASVLIAAGAAVTAVVGSGGVAGALARAAALAFAAALAVAVAVTTTIIIVVAFAYPGFAVGIARNGAEAVTKAVFILALDIGRYVMGVSAVAFTVTFLNKLAVDKQRQGKFQIILLLLTGLICFGSARALLRWDLTGPLLLFLGLLTLINAPFDWVSLGLTRALLRRGLELGSWWPYALALLDAVFAAIIISVLTMVAVLSIQLFDGLASRAQGDSARILPLGPLFNGIETDPSAPQFWWIYALLLSTMIPSLANLMIGGASLVRGIPWVTKLLLYLMPERGSVPSYDRQWVTVLLTAQVVVGAAIGILAQVFLAYLVIGWVLPVFGLDLLDLARAVAAPDLPGKLIAAVFGPA
jgi:hypothetical protein